MKPQETKRNGETTTFIFQDSKMTSHIFLRQELIGRTLRSYEGPFKVVKRNKKVIINKNGKNINVSIDRLKPVYILHEDDFESNNQKEKAKPNLKQPVEQRHSGRTSKSPVRFQIP